MKSLKKQDGKKKLIKKKKIDEQLFCDPYSLRDGRINEEIRRLRKFGSCEKTKESKVLMSWEKMNPAVFLTEKKTNEKQKLKEEKEDMEVGSKFSFTEKKQNRLKQKRISIASNYANFIEYKKHFDSEIFEKSEENPDSQE